MCPDQRWYVNIQYRTPKITQCKRTDNVLSDAITFSYPRIAFQLLARAATL